LNKIYSIYGHSGQETWHEKTFAEKEIALIHAKALAQIFFEDRNHHKDPELKLFVRKVFVRQRTRQGNMDKTIACWYYGYVPERPDVPERPEMLISVEEHEVN